MSVEVSLNDAGGLVFTFGSGEEISLSPESSESLTAALEGDTEKRDEWALLARIAEEMGQK